MKDDSGLSGGVIAQAVTFDLGATFFGGSISHIIAEDTYGSVAHLVSYSIPDGHGSFMMHLNCRVGVSAELQWYTVEQVSDLVGYSETWSGTIDPKVIPVSYTGSIIKNLDGDTIGASSSVGIGASLLSMPFSPSVQCVNTIFVKYLDNM